MSDASKINIGGSNVNLKDANARSLISQMQDTITNLASQVETLMNRQLSDIGDIIQSNTLDVESKVLARYGGAHWVQITDRFLLASGTKNVGDTGGNKDASVISHSHTFNGTNANTGGQSANHSHSGSAGGGGHDHLGYYVGVSSGFGTVAAGLRGAGSSDAGECVNRTDGSHTHSFTTGGVSVDHSHNYTPSGTISTTGDDGTDKNMPPYEVVYIWKRVE